MTNTDTFIPAVTAPYGVILIRKRKELWQCEYAPGLPTSSRYPKLAKRSLALHPTRKAAESYARRWTKAALRIIERAEEQGGNGRREFAETFLNDRDYMKREIFGFLSTDWCSSYECRRKARGWLLGPPGATEKPGDSAESLPRATDESRAVSPGVFCELCASKCIAEYHAKCGEDWMFIEAVPQDMRHSDFLGWPADVPLQRRGRMVHGV